MASKVKEFLTAVRYQPWYRGQIYAVFEEPGQEAVYAFPEPPLLRPIADYLAAKGIRLYRHQVEVREKIRQGKNVVLTTPTASGKSLAFTLPVLETLSSDRAATALYLYPMKALAYDQLKVLRSLEDGTGIRLYSAVYDGDTPKEQRAATRRRSRLILSNPHAFHQYLSWHKLWEQFLRNLRFVIIDEAHWYRGVYGSNVAFFIRRLRRVLDHYGSDPQFILASATMADPLEHARKLVGKDFVLVSADGSSRGKKTYVLWDAGAHPSRSEHRQAADLFAFCVSQGFQTLCFTASRKMAELTARWAGAEVEGIAAYRAGYLPEERRRLERDLKECRLKGIAATNALELGVDIGGLDAVVIAGWPGTVASFRQQSGRAGRSGQESLVIQVFFNSPLDGYLLRNHRFIFDAPSEQAVISLDNEHILKNHLKCAAEELPLTPGDEKWFGPAYAGALRAVVGEGNLTPVRTAASSGQRGNNAVIYVRPRGSAAQEVKLSPFDEGEFRVVCHGEILEVIDRRRALLEAHPGAIFLHQAEPYRVKELDLTRGIVLVEPAPGDLYTTTLSETEVVVKEVLGCRHLGRVELAWGKVAVSEKVYAYLVKRFDRVVAKEDVRGIPPIEFETIAVWCRIVVPPSLSGSLAGGLHAAEHALIAVTPLMAMCDRWDIGGHSTAHGPGGKPSIFIYDGFPGGTGITERLYRCYGELAVRALELVSGCNCQDGCPRCIMSPKCGSNNEPLDKKICLHLLGIVSRDTAGPRES